MTKRDDFAARKGRHAALAIAGSGVFWVLAILIGEKEGFSQQTRLILDLVALAGFVFAFWLIFQSWRARQDN
jgi:threonine/homoserine/homoserine lactone efflux protein